MESRVVQRLGKNLDKLYKRQTGGLTTHCTVCDTYYEKVPHTACQATLHSSVEICPFYASVGKIRQPMQLKHRYLAMNLIRVIRSLPVCFTRSQYKVGYKYCLSICNILQLMKGGAQGCDELLVV